MNRTHTTLARIAALLVTLGLIAACSARADGQGRTQPRSTPLPTAVVTVTPMPLITAVPTPLPVNCPRTRLLPDGGSIAVDYIDFVHVLGRTYLGNQVKAPAKPVLGRRLAVVNCTIEDLVADNHHEVVGPFRDGNAALLEVGTPIYAISGFAPQCRVAAVRDHHVVTFVADRRPLAAPCGRVER